MTSTKPDLFSAYRLGGIELSNRVVMAPMTRSRAIGGIPNELMREYYTQRASAGLIVTEGTAPSPDGLGYARIPGLYSAEQTAAWRIVTDSVHRAHGKIFAQLMHVGRVAHPLNLPAGARVVAPSSVRAEGQMYTDASGPQPMPEPVAMSEADLAIAREGFVSSARNAVTAGFDGIELHGANGYLLEQFLNPHTNRRTDAYGGTVENRARFVREVVDACVAAIGKERVGIRLSPYNTFNDLPVYDEVEAQYLALLPSLRGIAYVHMLQNPNPHFAATKDAVRKGFGGTFILNGGFDRDRAQEALASGAADLVSFGRPFISNPDLVARMRDGAALAEPSFQTFYTPGAAGYTDYPTR